MFAVLFFSFTYALFNNDDLMHTITAYGGMELQLYQLSTSALNEGDSSASHSNHFILGQRAHNTHWT